MSLTIVGANTPARIALDRINQINRSAGKSYLSLSSGRRINAVMDDASGFSIARNLESTERGLAQAIANVEYAGGILNLALGAYTKVAEAVTKIREMVVKGADDIYSSEQRVAIQQQIDALITEIDSIVAETGVQNDRLLDGSFTGKKLQTGPQAGSVLEVSLQNVDSSALSLTSISVADASVASTSLAQVVQAETILQEAMQDAGEYQARIRVREKAMRGSHTNTAATRSRIEDTDFATEYMRLTRYRILQELGLNALDQSLVAPQLVLSLIT